MNHPVEALDRVRKRRQEGFAVSVIFVDFSAPITSSSDVVQRAGKFEA